MVLTEGDAIIVTWSGGNGPWPYTVALRDGRVYAQTEAERAAGIVDVVKCLDAASSVTLR